MTTNQLPEIDKQLAALDLFEMAPAFTGNIYRTVTGPVIPSGRATHAKLPWLLLLAMTPASSAAPIVDTTAADLDRMADDGCPNCDPVPEPFGLGPHGEVSFQDMITYHEGMR